MKAERKIAKPIYGQTPMASGGQKRKVFARSCDKEDEWVRGCDPPGITPGGFFWCGCELATCSGKRRQKPRLT